MALMIVLFIYYFTVIIFSLRIWYTEENNAKLNDLTVKNKKKKHSCSYLMKDWIIS
jgi:hypothetical protein